MGDMKPLKRLLVVGLLLSLAWFARAQDSTVLRYEHAGRTRSYRLHLPPRISETRALVMVLHGGGGTGRQMERHSGFSKLADEQGFVVVYPEGVDKSWNDGRGDSISTAHRENLDDVGFLSELAEHLLERYQLDPRRVYVTGISNGGFMSHRLGAQAAHRFAAIAPVVGGLPQAWAATARPALPVSVMILQGTADPLVPYHGGFVQVGRQKRGQMVSTLEAVAHWVHWNGCLEEAPEIEPVPDRDPKDGCRVERRIYSGGRSRSVVELWHIEGGGHTWPGASQYLPKRAIGPVCRDFDASQEIWEFFQRHPRTP